MNVIQRRRVWTLAASMLLVFCVHAQEPYSRISAGINAGYALPLTEFERRWQVRPAGLLSAGTPFYAGRIEAGVMGFRATTESGRNDFSAGFFFAGWGPAVRPGRRLEWRTSVLTGDVLMLFDEGSSGFSRRENELAAGLRTSLVVEAFSDVELEAGIVGFRVFTSEPIDLIFAVVGARYRFDASPRLRRLLQ